MKGIVWVDYGGGREGLHSLKGRLEWHRSRHRREVGIGWDEGRQETWERGWSQTAYSWGSLPRVLTAKSSLRWLCCKKRKHYSRHVFLPGKKILGDFLPGKNSSPTVMFPFLTAKSSLRWLCCKKTFHYSSHDFLPGKKILGDFFTR